MLGKKTPYEYAQLAEKRGFIWLGPIVDHTTHKTGWQCKQSHVWHTTYKNIQDDYGCPYCAGNIPKTEQDYHDLANERGFKFLGPYPRKTSIKTNWECQLGHRWQGSYNKIKGGHGCHVCGRSKPKTPQDYYDLAKKRGFVWLGPEVQNTRTHTFWRCSNGHEWSAAYSYICNRGCPYCSGKVRKADQDYHELAKRYELEWLGPLPKNRNSKSKWRCKSNHEWETSYRSVFINNGGCPYCSKRPPLFADDYHRAAAHHNYLWIGDTVPQNAHTKTQWQCSKGHVWETAYKSIVYKGTGCIHCLDFVNGQRASKPQRQLHEMLGGELNHPVKRYHLDIALVSERICIEYDCWYFHQNNKDHDVKRDAYLIKHGWRILRIKSGVKLPTREQLEVSLALLRSGETYTEIVLDDWKG